MRVPERMAEAARQARAEQQGPHATPMVARLAAELGVDLATVTATGTGGRIRKQDVYTAARVRHPVPAPPAPVAARPVRHLRAIDGTGLPAVDVALAAENRRARVDIGPAALEYANRFGVSLSQDRVTGTGAGGEITVSDVMAAARRNEGQRAAQDAATARLTANRYVGQAAPESGYVPPFTASGVDPKVLGDVPAPVRRAVAAAETPQEVHRLVTAYHGMGDAEARAALAKDRSVSCDYGGLGPTHGRVPGWD